MLKAREREDQDEPEDHQSARDPEDAVANLPDPETLRERDQEQHRREHHGRPDVVVGVGPGGRSLHEGAGRQFVQVRAPLELGIDVLGHEARPGRRLRVRERVGREPRVEGDLVLGAEATFVQRHQLGSPLEPCLDPRVERGDVEQALLSSQRQELVGAKTDRRGLGIELRFMAVPPRRLIPAPGGRDRDEGEEERLQDLDDLLPARLRRWGRRILAFSSGKGPRDLDVEVVLHPHHRQGRVRPSVGSSRPLGRSYSSSGPASSCNAAFDGAK